MAMGSMDHCELATDCCSVWESTEYIDRPTCAQQQWQWHGSRGDIMLQWSRGGRYISATLLQHFLAYQWGSRIKENPAIIQLHHPTRLYRANGRISTSAQVTINHLQYCSLTVWVTSALCDFWHSRCMWSCGALPCAVSTTDHTLLAMKHTARSPLTYFA